MLLDAILSPSVRVIVLHIMQFLILMDNDFLYFEPFSIQNDINGIFLKERRKKRKGREEKRKGREGNG
jgi:hypothetical protein